MIKESDVYYNNPLFYIFMVLVLASFTYEIYYYKLQVYLHPQDIQIS